MRHYYLTRSGRLSRKNNTLLFELAGEEEEPKTLETEAPNLESEEEISLLESLGDDELGKFILEDEAENDSPIRVTDKRTIPIEDVDALWAFRELDLNARVLSFLSQHKKPIHFFNYYGFYAGSYYPREYLQAGFLLVKQVSHYKSKLKRLRIAKEFIESAMFNILRNLRYYGNRGVDLSAETEGVQAEVLRLCEVKTISELMGCEGRARAAYYKAFEKIIKRDVEFKKRVRRPPDNMVNALISFTNGLVYSACLTQIYRSQLNPTISFLHEPGFRRFSLALDLAEIFKPILADKLIFRMFNNGQLSEKDFAQDLNCCYLKESGRKKVLQEWDAKLNTTIEHRRLKRKVSYERLIRLECYKLVKHLSEVEEYKGFRAWW
jgi:CRISP-associated protein Cas1